MSRQTQPFNSTFKIFSSLFLLTFAISASLYLPSTLVNVRAALPPLTVAINQTSTQADPTFDTSLSFTAVFNRAIDTATFTASQVALDGTAPGARVTSITQIAPNDGTTFNITVTVTGPGTVIATIPGYSSSIYGTTGTQPYAIFANGTNIFTTNKLSNNITKIAPDGTSTIFGTTGTNPIGISIDARGRVYTINSGSNDVTRMANTGAGSAILGTTGANPHGITTDGAYMYISNFDSNDVTRMDISGVSTILGTTGTNPYGIVVSPGRTVYTANYGSNNVSMITPAGVSAILGTTGTNPNSIVRDIAGNVYTANGGSNNVTKITPDGTSTILGTTGTNPQGIAIDAAGNIYTSNFGSDNVSMITPAGVSTIIGNTGRSPQGITVDSSGNIFTANLGSDNVTKIIPNSGVQDTNAELSQPSTSTDNSISYISGDSDGVTSEAEAGAPNGGDGNNDGIADKNQPNVVSLPSTVNSKYITLAATGGTCGNITSINTSSKSNTSSLSFPAGAVNFTSGCVTPGQTMNAELIFYGTYDLAQATLQKINGSTITEVTGVTKSLVTIGGQPAIKFSYKVVDGGVNDQDGIVNGTIVDPVALGLPLSSPSASASPSPTTLIRTGGITENFQTVFVGIIVAMLAATGITWKMKNRKASQSK
jgi:streptogramin lyase